MDPAQQVADEVGNRLPRTRGDGPWKKYPSAMLRAAPPHPRGWTSHHPAELDEGRGSPAPAGMDLVRHELADAQAGLPRTRGDGPIFPPPGRASFPAPPHPRGWTPSSDRRDSCRGGSPAPAGMDPSARASAALAPRLPRTRGDGPRIGGVGAMPVAAPPHPRGWTPRVACRGPVCAGSPAPAGMDLSADQFETAFSRLPRTRGDGPRQRREAVPPVWAPPHPRGWTRTRHRSSPLRGGSPAPAGMDPESLSPNGIGSGLPRTRGDGPDIADNIGDERSAPPHPRGWTRCRLAEGRRGCGSPAPAGMDPRPVGTRAAGARLPRTRGDGPRHSLHLRGLRSAPPHPRGWTRHLSASHSSARGSPAPAGMDPIALYLGGRRVRLPRTRGDGPWVELSTGYQMSAPPHPRGRTFELIPAGVIGGGSPAPAGMDPLCRWRSGPPSRLPRTRGDGPHAQHDILGPREAPPHPRGWTL